ncbi:hypothetical protein ACFQ0G_26690 [Streptomyces chiangmaiensis]
MVLSDARDGHPPQVHGGVLRLLTGEDRRRQVDRDEIGESRYGHLHQLLGGPLHIEAGADGRAGLAQQVEVSTSRLRPLALGAAANGQLRDGDPDDQQQRNRPAILGTCQ